MAGWRSLWLVGGLPCFCLIVFAQKDPLAPKEAPKDPFLPPTSHPQEVPRDPLGLHARVILYDSRFSRLCLTCEAE